MTPIEVLLRNNTPIKDITKLPQCERCGNCVATVPIEIGEMQYALCVRCVSRPPTWSIPK